jgi:hypothetical protein
MAMFFRFNASTSHGTDSSGTASGLWYFCYMPLDMIWPFWKRIWCHRYSSEMGMWDREYALVQAGWTQAKRTPESPSKCCSRFEKMKRAVCSESLHGIHVTEGSQCKRAFHRFWYSRKCSWSRRELRWEPRTFSGAQSVKAPCMPLQNKTSSLLQKHPGHLCLYAAQFD